MNTLTIPNQTTKKLGVTNRQNTHVITLISLFSNHKMILEVNKFTTNICLNLKHK